MKLNIISKSFVLFSVALFFSVLGSVFCLSATAEIEWQRGYGAIIDGKYLAGAYSGGLTSITPTFCDIDGDGDYDMFIGEYDGNINFWRNMTIVPRPGGCFLA